MFRVLCELLEIQFRIVLCRCDSFSVCATCATALCCFSVCFAAAKKPPKIQQHACPTFRAAAFIESVLSSNENQFHRIANLTQEQQGPAGPLQKWGEKVLILKMHRKYSHSRRVWPGGTFALPTYLNFTLFPAPYQPFRRSSRRTLRDIREYCGPQRFCFN